MNKIDLWESRFQRMRRRPPKEVIVFGLKTLKKFPKHIDKKGIDEYSPNEIFYDFTNKNTFFESTKLKFCNNFYFNPNDSLEEKYKNNFPDDYKKTIQLSEKYCKGNLKFFNTDIKFQNWHKINNFEWSLEPSSTINYFGKNRKQDIKYIWELNRMHFITVLAKAYYITGKEKYSKSVINYLSSWIDENPYLKGVNWMEGIEAAIRMYSWIFSYAFIINSRNLTPKINLKILKSIYLHGKFIKDFLSDKWYTNNNHILAELSALILISISFPNVRQSKNWLKFALKNLVNEVESQILTDGATWESSTGYQKFDLELLLYPLILLDKNNINVQSTIYKKVKKMAIFLNFISIKDGKIPRVGDEDQGFVLNLCNWDYDNIFEISSLANFYYKQKNFLNNKSELVFWISNGKINSENNISYSYPTFKVFQESGYVVFKSKDDYLLFITGIQNRRYLHAPHRHVDVLSFVYGKNNCFFIDDPGTYTYFSADIMRNKFRRIQMHNTITVDDKNPSDLSGLFEMSPNLKTKIEKQGIFNDMRYVVASQNNYKFLIHKRAVLQFQKGFIIYDFITGDGKNHSFQSFLHLNPKVVILEKNKKSVLLKNEKETLFIRSDKEILEDNSVFSSKYGEKNDSKMLKVNIAGNSFENSFFLTSNKKSLESINLDLSEFKSKILKCS